MAAGQPLGEESRASCSKNRKLLNALADVVLLAAFDLCPKSGVDDKQEQHEQHRHRVRCGKRLLVAVRRRVVEAHIALRTAW
jgi:hypothetical protein